MRALLDVNVLLALFDRDHVDHVRAREWLSAEIDQGWASCPITENGFVRIISQPRYPNPIAPTEAIRRLAAATATEHHQFWSYTASLLDPTVIDGARVLGHRQVTDAYLLAVAVANDGRFATFDDSVPLGAVKGANARHLAVLG